MNVSSFPKSLQDNGFNMVAFCTQSKTSGTGNDGAFGTEPENSLNFKNGYLHINTRYFTSDNQPNGIENATHNTLPKLTWLI
jgi:hypothetical protein